MVVRGSSARAVQARLARDVYAVEGAWDMSRLELKRVGASV